MAYQVKTPWWLRRFYSKLTWRMPEAEEAAVYLTFDDGPHPGATPYVLEQLARYNAKATFFCLGKNAAQYEGIYNNIIAGGHTVANHTQNHVNGWKSTTDAYLWDINVAATRINSKLFRPPYGHIRLAQAKRMLQEGWKIIMWDVLSGDFDVNITPDQCFENVVRNIEPGSIVVFHDSEKAWPRMSYALPQVLEYCKNKNWSLKAIPGK